MDSFYAEWFHLVMEITLADRVEAEAYTQERLKLVLDSTRLGMWDWNPQTNEVVFDQNWAAMLGLTLADLTMSLEDWSSRVHPDDMEKCMADIQAHLNGEVDFYENLHRMKHADGHWVYILDRGKVVEFDADGKPLRFTGTHADVTPLKNAEFAASLATKAKDRFFSTMSHELRAPIHAMLGVLEHVQKLESDAELRQKLGLVKDSGQHLLLLVNDILDIAKLHQSEIKLQLSTFDLVELVQYVVNLFRYRAREKHLELSSDVAEDMHVLWVETDRARLSQILINLVSNAIKFTHQGEVTLRLKRSQRGIELSVVDTGRGIADVNKIFQPYYSKEQEDVYGAMASTGLGLSISQELAKLLNISMSVQSVVDQGSTFSLLLPSSIIRQPKLVEARDIINPPTPDLWPQKTIVVVDDVPVNRMLLSLMLESTPAKVIVAEDSAQVLAMLKSTPVDIVLTDLHMPDMDGIQLTQAIAKLNLVSQPVVIIASADRKADVWDSCRNAGAQAYLEKPFNETQLLSILQQFVLEQPPTEK